jgi:hypothetical protein
VFLHKVLYLLPYLSPNLIPLTLFRDAKEKKEEKKRRKKRKTGPATPGLDLAATATPATPPSTAGEEEDRIHGHAVRPESHHGS